MPSLKQPMRHTDVSRFCLGALLGAAVFLILYGAFALDPCYDSWIYCGYVEEDVIQHYAAWQYLRNQSWDLPLCWIKNAALPLGSSAAFADPLPWAALFFKVLSPLLPETFQYFGLVSLLHYMLQGGFAWLLLALFDRRVGVCVPGTLLLCCQPVLLERTFRHLSLSAQWLVLWMLYLYFVSHRQSRLPWFAWAVLFCLIPGVHAYFLPMAFALLCAAVLENILRTRRLLRPAGLVVLCMAGALASARVLGVIVPHTPLGGDPYGSYSMNLNALINPSSMDLYAADGRLDWSLLLPTLPQTAHQYDGFNFPGLGVLLTAGVMLLYGIAVLLRALRRKEGAVLLKRAAAFLYRHIGLLLACAACTVFAVSNNVFWGERALLQLPLPRLLSDELFAAFRASGRIFWPVGYLLTLAVILFPARHLSARRLSCAALCLLLAVQLGDMGGVLACKAAYFRRGPLVSDEPFHSEKAQQLFAATDEIRCMGNMFDYRLAESLIRCNPDIQTDIIFFARGNFGEALARYEENYADVLTDRDIPDDVLYIASEESVCTEVLQANPVLSAWQIGKFWFFGIAADARPAPDRVGALA